MRAHCSLFVDAGYLLAAGSTRVTGTSLRSAADVDVAKLLEALIEQCEKASGLPLLRALWYDAGTRQGAPSQEQRQLGLLPRTKLRLGRTGFNGEQKGVDVKLALDLISLSRNRATEVAFLVSGDDDLSEAVEEAQQHGVQVIALAVPGADGNPIAVSQNLQLTVDEVHLIDGSAVDAHIRKSVAAQMREVAESTAAQAETAAAPAAPVPAPPPLPTVPSPALMPPRPSVAPVPAPIELPPARTVPVYSTATGERSVFAMTELFAGADLDEAVADVVDKVVVNWWRSATPQGKTDLARSRPTIPPELDRALLSDLSNRLSVVEIPQDWRFRLRDAFWEKLDRL